MLIHFANVIQTAKYRKSMHIEMNSYHIVTYITYHSLLHPLTISHSEPLYFITTLMCNMVSLTYS